MSLETGHKLAHYEIVEPIGKGGMGEVYCAKDSKLGRDVAIKVLPEEYVEKRLEPVLSGEKRSLAAAGSSSRTEHLFADLK